MSLLSDVLARLKSLLFATREDRELAEEIRFHIDRETERNLAAGLRPREARRQAHIKFGGVERMRERAREARGVAGLETVLRDLGFATRQLKRRRGFATVAVAAIAVGVGASTALFSVVDGVLLEPLPYPEPDRLVQAWPASEDETYGWISFPDFQDWRDRARTFSHLGSWTDFPPDMALVRDGEPAMQVRTAWVAGDFFGTLAVSPMLGRWFGPDDVETSRPVAVLSAGLWRRAFGADSAIVGRNISLDFRSVEVLGVMPEGFAFPEPNVEAWVPMTLAFVGRYSVLSTFRGIRSQRVIGRLADGVDVATARAELTGIADELARTYPASNEGRTSASIENLHDVTVGDVSTGLWSLLGAAGFFLALATATIANLLLVRGMGRRREVALRRSLGASERRIRGQLVTEMLALALFGGAVGLGVAWLLIAAVRSSAASVLPRTGSIHLGATSMLVAIAATAIVALLPGVLAALRLMRTASARGPSGGSVSEDVRGVRHRRSLVAGEAALATVLLVGATLLIRSFEALAHVDPGFDADGGIAMSLSLPTQRYPDASETRRAYREILTGLRQLPGVVAAGAVTDLPMRSSGEGYAVIAPGINEPESVENWPTAQRIAISEDAVDALGVTVLRGRDFSLSDGPGDPPVALVNEAMVREVFLGQDPIGRFVSPGENPREVVGVVRDVRQSGPGEDPPPAFYVPLDQEGARPGLSFVVRAEGDPLALVTAMRDVVDSVDPQVPVTDFVELDRLASDARLRPRFLAAVMSGFATLATMLAVLGVYAVLAQSVRARSREIGLRSALGATRGNIVREILAEGLMPTAAGLLVGLTAAAALSGYLQSLLFQVEPLDPASFATGALMLLAASVVACTAPAAWAARLDPARALKTEAE